MENKHYYITGIRERNFVDAGTNKKAAIKAGKARALQERQSVELWRCHKVGGCGETLGRYYIGILEFPYYLRNCPLTEKDITVNLIDR
jgi:hypothetical protein